MTGYSPRPLIAKLGIKPGTRVVLLAAPTGYAATLGALPPGAKVTTSARGPQSFIHVFTRSRADLAKRIKSLNKTLKDDGTIWVSWPKKSSGVASDLTEDTVRDLALPLGLVDVKVCAVDDTWSGLKLVRRVANRGRS
jgi:CRISPR/Cas system-associated endonuclease/helicase Cas3